MHANEGFLGDVHGVVGVFQHAQGELVHPSRVLVDELAECLPVAALRGPDQLAVVALALAHWDAMDVIKFTRARKVPKETGEGAGAFRESRKGQACRL